MGWNTSYLELYWQFLEDYRNNLRQKGIPANSAAEELIMSSLKETVNSYLKKLSLMKG